MNPATLFCYCIFLMFTVTFSFFFWYSKQITLLKEFCHTAKHLLGKRKHLSFAKLKKWIPFPSLLFIPLVIYVHKRFTSTFKNNVELHTKKKIKASQCSYCLEISSLFKEFIYQPDKNMGTCFNIFAMHYLKKKKNSLQIHTKKLKKILVLKSDD